MAKSKLLKYSEFLSEDQKARLEILETLASLDTKGLMKLINRLTPDELKIVKDFLKS